MTPLKPDETLCQWCNNVFVSPDAYEAHKPARGGCWGPGLGSCGLTLNERTQRWEFANHRTTKPRRSQAEAAFDRLTTSAMNWPRNKQGRAEVQADIDKVRRALERARR